MTKSIFTSTISFGDAERKALKAGFSPTGRARNKRNEYVVFGRYM